MILSDNGRVEIKGHRVLLCSELACLIRALREEMGISEDMIDKAIELSKIPKETLDKEAKEASEKLGMEMAEILIKAFTK